jgi:phosphinothricin acetyltransferase
VYLDPAVTGRGIGRALLNRLIELAASGGYREMIAVIGDSGNTASVRLHARAGFVHVGTLRNVGFKLDRWLDTVLMQKTLIPDA